MGTLKNLGGCRIFISGASGLIGSEVASLAKSSGAIVSAPTRASGFDIRSREQVAELLNNFRPDYIIHAAAAGVSQSIPEKELWEINVSGTDNLLSAASRLSGSPKCILLGTCAEYALSDVPMSESARLDPRTPYAQSKVAAAEVARRYATNQSVQWLRIFNVYGAGEKLPRLLPYLVDCARKGVVAEVSAGEQRLDYTPAPDVAEAILRMACVQSSQPGFSVCNVGSGRTVTLREFMEAVRNALESSGLKLDLKLGAKPYRPTDAMTCLPDISLMLKTINWSPPVDLNSGLRRAIIEMLTRQKHDP